MATTNTRKKGNWRRPAAWLLGASLLAVVGFFGGRALLDSHSGPVRLVVYAWSTESEVLTQGIFPAFEQAWEAETGRDLTIEGVFGASGTLAGQINLGAPADVALFSNPYHVTYLHVGRRIRPETEPVVIGLTPMVIVTRPGNPAGILTFADLAQDDLKLVHADPRSSGAGEWSLLAEYGSALQASDSHAAAEAQLKTIWRNVRLLGPSARAAMTLFELGAGDALVTYEQDALLARDRGVPLEIVAPPGTVVAEHVAVLVDDNLKTAERPAAEAFIQFLLSETGQAILSRYHLRPAGEPLADLEKPLTAADLGGWTEVYKTLVESLWETDIAPTLKLEPSPTLLGPGEG